MDNFITLSNRLLSRAPATGIALSQQLINDAWRSLQARREWSWRRRHGTLAPPDLYQTGAATTNVAAGAAHLITGVGTTWTPAMVGSQIRIGGLLNPFYTITQWNSATSIEIDQPWAGPDVTAMTYQILKIYYSMPEDFGYFYTIYSVKDAYQLWTDVTEAELSVIDPQRTNQGQSYALAFYDYANDYSGIVGPTQQVVGVGSGPVSTTTDGYTYPANLTYAVTITLGGPLATALFAWKVVGSSTVSPSTPMSGLPQDLSNGVQVYFPEGPTYVQGDTWIVQCEAVVSSGTPRFELWPSATYSGYLYPYIYYAREMDLTAAKPQLPLPIASRGEVILEMALAACARYPGATIENPNPYFSLALAKMHDNNAEKMIWELERNDREVGDTGVEWKAYQMAPAPWMTGQWQQHHGGFLR